MQNESQRPPIWEGLDQYVYDAYLHGCNTYSEIPIIAKCVYDFKRKHNKNYTPKEALDLALYFLLEESEQKFDMKYEYHDTLEQLFRLIEKGGN